MNSTPTTDRTYLEELGRRRAALRDSMGALENALAAPVNAHRGRWVERVEVALVELAADLRRHVEVTEGPGGLHRDILATAPRLSGAVARLAEDHRALIARVEELIDEVQALDRVDPDMVRILGTALLGRLVRHRQHGADLVFEAYELDLGGED